MIKLGRRYKLTFQTDVTASKKNAIEITNPITLQFDIDRNTASSLNSASFRIYNLSETNRSLIFQNRTSINNARDRKKVILQAGYSTALNRDEDLTTIFTGDLLEAYSYRQGTDVITYINAQDGGFAAYNSRTNTTLQKGLSLKDIASNLIAGFKENGVEKGVIGNIEGTAKTSTALNGNNFSLLTKDYKDQVFIDLEKVNILNQNEYIKSSGGKVLLITSESGLLGTPLRQGSNVVIDMLFEPRVHVGNLVEISAQFNPLFNGQYKVMGIKHSGTISEAIGGDCKTTLQLFIGNELLGELKGI